MTEPFFNPTDSSPRTVFHVFHRDGFALVVYNFHPTLAKGGRLGQEQNAPNRRRSVERNR
ncbi:hypothetical protein E3U23_13420 [Erythrobacter litoralis]|uniref:hypothetical protein n=1 Tax=Erythrobacter litoralis TaxID=39960 RepID=UPI002435619C|nr:hypothetical protein [Erythrobacter litoralis]MDG6080189.1 hypothetical protein [Erythrobacter litoralis]